MKLDTTKPPKLGQAYLVGRGVKYSKDPDSTGFLEIGENVFENIQKLAENNGEISLAYTECLDDYRKTVWELFKVNRTGLRNLSCNGILVVDVKLVESVKQQLSQRLSDSDSGLPLSVKEIAIRDDLGMVRNGKKVPKGHCYLDLSSLMGTDESVAHAETFLEMLLKFGLDNEAYYKTSGTKLVYPVVQGKKQPDDRWSFK